MPVYPPHLPDSFVLWGRMNVISDAAPLENGVCVFAIPARCKAVYMTLNPASPLNADVTLTFRSKHGVMSTTFVAPNGTPISPGPEWLIPLDRFNSLDAGDFVSIESDGGGTSGGSTCIGLMCARA